MSIAKGAGKRKSDPSADAPDTNSGPSVELWKRSPSYGNLQRAMQFHLDVCKADAVPQEFERLGISFEEGTIRQKVNPFKNLFSELVEAMSISRDSHVGDGGSWNLARIDLASSSISGLIGDELPITQEMTEISAVVEENEEMMLEEQDALDSMQLTEEEGRGARGEAPAAGTRSDPYSALLAYELAQPGAVSMILNFDDTYRAGINRALLDGATIGGSKLYQYTTDGYLARSFPWLSALPLNCMDLIDVGTRKVQIFVVILHAMTRRNRHLKEMFELLRTQSDLTLHRYLLAESDLESSTWKQPAIYVFHPPWSRRDLRPGIILPAYVGQTQNARVRSQSHVQKGVNRRVRQMGEAVPLIGWHNTVIASFRSTDFEFPTSGLLLCEHFVLSAFRLTNAETQGLNVNIIDRIRFAVLIPARNCMPIISALDRILVNFPDQRFPSQADYDGWCYVVRSLLPTDCEAKPTTVASMCTGGARKFLWSKVNPTNLIRYFARDQQDPDSVDGGAEGFLDDPVGGDSEGAVKDSWGRYGYRPASASHLATLGRPEASPFLSDGPHIQLDILRDRFRSAVAENLAKE